MPIALTEVSTAVLNGRIYVVGGLTTSFCASTAVQIYDPYLDQWTQGPPMPIGLDHANVAAAGGKLYVLGGLQQATGGTRRSFEFDPAANSWREIASMPTDRGAAGTAELGGKIYVAGGQRGSLTVNEFAVYDPAAGAWETLPPMPTARNHLTGQAPGGLFYAIGGRVSTLIGTVEVYDPAARAWSPRTPMLTARSGIASGTLRGRIQVLGGEASPTPAGTFSENEEYDPLTNSWQALMPLPTPRHGFYGATLNRRLYAPGGGPSAGLTISNVNEVFFFSPDQPPQATAAGLVDAASFQPRIAAGGLVSLFGQFLADSPAQASRFPLPISLYEANVQVNDQPVPHLYVSPTQINFQIPYNASGTTNIKLSNAGVVGASFAVNVVQAAPAIFSGAVVHNSNFQPVTSTAPAVAREVLAVFCAGLGPVQPTSAAGQPAPTSPLAQTTLSVTATIGGRNATVLFAGLAPGFAGLYQVNVIVPDNTGSGAVAMWITAGGLTSNTVMISIR